MKSDNAIMLINKLQLIINEMYVFLYENLSDSI